MKACESRVWADHDGWSWMLLRGGMILNSGHEDTKEEAEREVETARSIAKLVDWYVGA